MDVITYTKLKKVTNDAPEMMDSFKEVSDWMEENGGQADWNQNDPSKPDYIKNRICYEELIEQTYLDNKKLIFEYYGGGSMSTKTFNSTCQIPDELQSYFQKDPYSIKVIVNGEKTEIFKNEDYSDNIDLSLHHKVCPEQLGETISIQLNKSANHFQVSFQVPYEARIEEGLSINITLICFYRNVTPINPKFSPGAFGKGALSEIFNDYNNNKADGDSSHAEGNSTTASAYSSHAEGSNTTASGDYGSHAEGHYTTASAFGSHAEGNGTTASGSESHAEGDSTTASAYGSHAEGRDTTASGYYSHAEGWGTKALENASHAEGASTTASGSNSHAEGGYTTASGTYSHAEGSGTTASGDYSHAEGYYTTASGENQHVQGRYNLIDTNNGAKDGSPNNKYAHIVGNGNGAYEKGSFVVTRSNAHTLDWNGVGWFASDVKIGKTSQDDATISLKDLDTKVKSLPTNATTLTATVPEGITADANTQSIINALMAEIKTLKTKLDAPKEMILTSSTPESIKKFKITVNDEGAITATSVT